MSKTSSWMLAAMAVVTLAGCNAATVSGETPPQTYRILGAVTGATRQGVTMTLSAGGTGTATTAADGSYQFTGVGDGTYTVTPSKVGYTFAPTSLTFTVNGADATGKDFAATAIPPQTYWILGAVTGATRQGVTMTLSAGGTGTATTAADGSYQFTGVANGTYTVTPSKVGYTFAPASLTFTVNGADATGKDFVATAIPPVTYRILGAVTGATRQGVTMTLSAGGTGTATTAADGSYQFTGVGNGTYTVTPSKVGYTFAPTSLTFTVNGADATGKDFVATAIPPVTYRILGAVTGATMQGVTMTLSAGGTGAATTAADGSYQFTGVANGTYTVTPSKVGYTFAPASLTFTVNGADATGKDFVATAIPPVTYRILGAVTGATRQGVTMTLSAGGTGTATTAADGSYQFTGVGDGTYTVTPSKVGYTFAPTSLTFTVNGADATGKDFVATASGSTAPVLDPVFPYCAWINNARPASMTVGPFSTPGPRTYVAVVSFYTPANDPYPLSVTWTGGTPAGATGWTRRIWPNDGSIHWTAEIWTATSTGGLSGAQVTATRANPGDNSTSILCVYSYSGVGGIGAVADHHSPMSDVGNNLSGQYTVTINAQAASSQIVGISQGGDTYIPFTPYAGTTIDYQQNDGGADGGAAAWRKTTPTTGPGNVTLGCTDRDLAFAVEAIELLAAP